MKQLFVGGLLALCATAGFAQNSATVTQNGTSLTGVANQTGNLLTSVISQTGTGNANSTATTSQTGTGHSATINQNDGSTYNRAYITQKNGTSLTGANSATISYSNNSGGTSMQTGVPGSAVGTEGNWSGISQTGDGNKASIVGDGANTKANFAETWQKGSTNTASTIQSGGLKNRAEIFQGNDTRDGVTEVPPGQGVNVEVTGNTALIDQSNGSTSSAYLRQFSNGNTGKIYQSGPDSFSNTATLTQGDGTNISGAISNTALIFQGGPDPTNQGAVSSRNQTTVTQLGTTGYVRVYQAAFAGGGSTTNIASVSQLAGSSNNEVYIGQYSDEAGTSADRNLATVVMAGANDLAEISQIKSSKDDIALIKQGVGSTNDQAYIDQNDGTFNKATITQNMTAVGSNNIASIEQGRYFDTAPASSMTAVISQEGSRNDARLRQLGSASTATITQAGNNNIVTGNSITTNTGGTLPTDALFIAGNHALQDGTGHKMTVTQTSPNGTNTTIFNTATLDQMGTGNIMTVDQTATTFSNVTTVSQTGTGNNAAVMQNGVNP